jgi:hypothetical protein
MKNCKTIHQTHVKGGDNVVTSSLDSTFLPVRVNRLRKTKQV